MKNKKYYVVWKGLKTGVFDSWDTCKAAIHGVQGALYKSFPTYEEAQNAFNTKPTFSKKPNNTHTQTIIVDSLSVDAACSGNPGIMEYRGVYVKTGEEVFKKGPYTQGTNNIGEFLALVHGLALLKKTKSTIPIYSDSMTAISWVKKKKCNTKLAQESSNNELFEIITRAENWLQQNTYSTQILKWDTKSWGEIPADFGRK